jgi:peptide/nickel transport system substrate-binding protein
MEIVLVTKFNWTAGYNGFLAGFATQFDPDMIYSQFVTGASGNTMHYSNAEVDRLLTEGRHTQNIAARKKIYGKFEEVYARSPGILLVAYMDGNYVGISGIEGLDTTRVLGHHSVGVMWNIENCQITR